MEQWLLEKSTCRSETSAFRSVPTRLDLTPNRMDILVQHNGFHCLSKPPSFVSTLSKPRNFNVHSISGLKIPRCRLRRNSKLNILYMFPSTVEGVSCDSSKDDAFWIGTDP